MLPLPPPNRVDGCDAPSPAPVYLGSNDAYICRCMICARCNHHTGNTSQGHYWAFCKITKTEREFHFCCPDNCELENA